MKARLTTVLSLAGVVFAGSAAALVNSQVLRPPSTASGERLTVVSLPGSSPNGTAPADAPPAASQATYQVAEAGAVVLDTSHGALTLVGVSPSSGWAVLSAANPDGATIDVALQAGNTVVEFHATLLFGVVSTTVTTTDLTASTAPPTTVRHTTSRPSQSTSPSTTEESHHGNSGSDSDDDHSESEDDD